MLKIKRMKLMLVILSCLCSGFSLAEQPPLSLNSANEENELSEKNGLLMLDYSKISLRDGGKFDMLGVHYLHELYDWLYFGVGVSGPVVEGNYGGFFVIDLTLHAKKRIYGNWFVDGGMSFGGGGGGESVEHIKELSGSGQFVKKYLGVGYQINDHYFGINYANINMADSLISDSMFNLYYQKAISFSLGSYSNKQVTSHSRFRKHDSIFSVDVNRMSQIDPQGIYKGGINLISPQFSQFYSENGYFYFAIDLGLAGLDWYNQIHGGVGHKIPWSENVNLYAQLGLGTGGWVTDTIETGPGLLVYPKVKAEYLWDKNMGFTLSAGYLDFPKGTSKNWTVGLGVNYHLSADSARSTRTNTGYNVALKRFRVNIFYNTLFDISHNNKEIENINMGTLQVDYLLNENFYIPLQLGAAVNDYEGYAGYVEMYVGLGWQSHYLDSEKFQTFVQLMYGMNDVGVDEDKDVGPLLNASVGVNYALSDQLALYAQVGKTISVDQHLKSNYDNAFEDTSIGFGITYRFSLPAYVFK